MAGKKTASRFLEVAIAVVIIAAFAAFNAAPLDVVLGIIVLLILGIVGIQLFKAPFVSGAGVSEPNKNTPGDSGNAGF